MEISRPDGHGDIANLGLALFEAKQLLANVQRGIARRASEGSRRQAARLPALR
jgi:hypothetical protein